MDIYGTSVEREYADFAGHWAAGESPVLATWARGVSTDPEVCALIAQLPQVKRQPNLVFAAARWHGAGDTLDYAPLREVLVRQWPAVRATVLARSTQTNEVARCATWLPALAAYDGPVALVEAGPSAGLCLVPDRYSYRWSRAGSVVTLDPAAGPSPVVLGCAVSGPAPLPTRMPEVVWRAGIDLNPLDVRDDDAMAWLRTLVWPGPAHGQRVDRLAGAVALAREDPPRLVSGDLLDGIPALVEAAQAESPAGTTVVVVHSAVVVYLEPDDRDRFDATMRGLVADGSCHWISNEAGVVLPRVTGAAEVPAHRFVLGVDGHAVGWTHPHGASLHWR